MDPMDEIEELINRILIISNRQKMKSTEIKKLLQQKINETKPKKRCKRKQFMRPVMWISDSSDNEN